MCKLEDFSGLKLCPAHEDTIKNELDVWHRAYLPLHPGDTVLDLGAGCGETAQFYLMHGAGRVIAIEPDILCSRNLKENFKNDTRVLVIAQKIDKVKMDIEGSEEFMSFEVHFPFEVKKIFSYLEHTSREVSMNLLVRDGSY